MKKLSLLIVATLVLLLAACGGGGGNAGDTNSNESKNEESKQEGKQEAKLEIVDSTGAAWKDSIDTVWVHSSAIFKNTGSVPVDIGETQMNFKGQDGSILSTATMIYSVPSVVLPGETAYISETTILEGAAPEDYKETTYNYGYEETSAKQNLLEISGEKGTKGDEWTPYRVTGVVKNTTEELQDDIRIAAGLFDSEGKLLGVLTGSVDVGVAAGSEAGFELTYPELPADVADKVSTIDVKAYAWTW